jgi:hypothetical protein
MKLTRSRPEVSRKTEVKTGFARYSPLVAVPLILCIPLAAEAQDYRCTAKVKRGKMGAITSAKARRGKISRLKVNMLADKGYVEVSFPDSYTRALMKAAATLDKSQRGYFIANRILTSLETARSALGSKRRARLRCAPPDVSAVPLDALPVRLKGTGTKADPFMVEVPVPIEGRRLVDQELYSNKGNPSYLKVQGVESYFAVRFVGTKSTPRITTLKSLTLSVARLINGRVEPKLRKAGIRNFTPFQSLRSASSGLITSAAANHKAIRDYIPELRAAAPASAAPEDKQPTKRRRVIRFK